MIVDPMPVLEAGLVRLLLDRNTGRACVIDRARRCLYANAAWLAAAGRTSSEMVGHPLPGIDAQHAMLIDRAFDGIEGRAEGWVTPSTGERQWLDEVVVPHRSADGRIDAIVLFVRDETALKRQQTNLAARIADLEASDALKSAIVDNALVALISTDARGAIVEFNPSAESMFGRAREDVLGRRVSDIVIPERFRAPHEAGMQRLDRGQAPRVLGKRLEMHAMRADGSEFPIEMVLWRTTVVDTVFYTASIVDVTERRNAALEIERQRESLRQTEKLGAMGSLLAGVAHELNNPLAIVMGRAGMLEERCDGAAALDVDDLRLQSRRIREAADRCGRIVRTFLDMARRRPAQRGHVALNDLVRAAIDMLGYGYRTHGIVLDVALADDLPAVEADADQLGQIVMNLLVNAQQVLAGSQRARRVLLQTGVEPGDADERRVWLRVADNGPGVDDALRGRVFEPYFTTKPEGSGTGLGLAMSRSMARDHGGDLVLEPSSVDGGAAFRLVLPVSGRAVASIPTVESIAADPTVVARVLVVDDESDLTDLMRELLEQAGYEVATAESGAVALELLSTARFDAIVSDLRMPDIDGAALWREVSTRDPVLATRMLFVTGDTLSPDAARFLSNSRCTALDKPFSKADLLAGVAGLLRHNE